MQILKSFARAYPWQSGMTLVALLLAGIMEGLSLSTLLPLLNAAMESQSGEQLISSKSNSPTDFGLGTIVPNILQGFGVTPTLGVFLVIIVLGILFKTAFLLLAKKQVGYTVAHVATDLRLGLVRALLATRWEYYLRQPSGILVNAIATEAQRASHAYLLGANVVALVIQIFIYLCVAFLVSWQATFASLLASLVLLYILNKLIRIARRAGKRQTKLLQSLLSRMGDSLQSVKPLKAMARESLFGSLLETETIELNHALRREVWSREALRAAQEFLLTLLVAIGLYIAVVQWEMPIAKVIMLVLLLAQMLSRIGKAQHRYQGMITYESAYWAIEATIQKAEQEREKISGNQTPCLTKAIRLDHVHFAYQETLIIQDLCMTIPAGCFVSIVGASGTGKTTVVDLVTGLLRPQQGEIWIDNLPLKQIDIRHWRKMIGYVPQDTLLLHDTIFRNVTLGDPDLRETDVEYALQAAGAWDFVRVLPQGIHTSVGERGSTLSGGQRQRIAIARALAHHPTLLILDEATSALDPENESAICQTLRQLRGKLTILAISHQSALVDEADHVYRLYNGVTTLIKDRATLDPGLIN